MSSVFIEYWLFVKNKKGKCKMYQHNNEYNTISY